MARPHAIRNELGFKEIVPEREVIVRTPYMPSAEAHDRFLRARYFYNRRAPGDLERARNYYEQALRIDPGFARAWAGLAGVYGAQMSTGEISTESGLPSEQKPSSRCSRSIRAWLRAMYVQHNITGRSETADAPVSISRKLMRSIRTIRWCLTYYAHVLLWHDRFDEALEAMRRSVVLDPVSPVQHGVLAHFLRVAGHYDEARAEQLNELELNPAGKADLDIDLGWILILQHRFAEAREMIERWPEGDDRNQGLALVDHALGRRTEAEASLKKLAAGTDEATAVCLAEVYAQWGDVDEAFRRMESARVRSGPNPWLAKQWRSGSSLPMSPFLRPLHGDPRWDAMSRTD